MQLISLNIPLQAKNHGTGMTRAPFDAYLQSIINTTWVLNSCQDFLFFNLRIVAVSEGDGLKDLTAKGLLCLGEELLPPCSEGQLSLGSGLASSLIASFLFSCVSASRVFKLSSSCCKLLYLCKSIVCSVSISIPAFRSAVSALPFASLCTVDKSSQACVSLLSSDFSDAF